MAGERVIARGYGNAAYVRKLIAINGKAAMICPVESYEAILAGKDEPPMLGFPVEDVFEYDEIEAAALAEGRQPQWDRLRPISP